VNNQRRIPTYATTTSLHVVACSTIHVSFQRSRVPQCTCHGDTHALFLGFKHVLAGPLWILLLVLRRIPGLRRRLGDHGHLRHGSHGGRVRAVTHRHLHHVRVPHVRLNRKLNKLPSINTKVSRLGVVDIVCVYSHVCSLLIYQNEFLLDVLLLSL